MKEGNVMASDSDPTRTPEPDPRPARQQPGAPPPDPDGRSRRRLLVLGVAVALVGGAVVLVATQLIPSKAHAGTGGSHKATADANCQALPSGCSLPDATNSGVPAGTLLKTVPGQVSSGTGWQYNTARQEVDVTGNGAVLTGLSIPYDVNITASNVTLSNDRIVTTGTFGISIRHTNSVTVENSAITGTNATTGRLNSAISDVYGDSTNMVIKNNDITDFRSAVQLTAGLVTGNYIHDPGYLKGDHTNGVIANGGTQQLTITHNTILNPLDQTDAITLDTDQVAGPVSNKTIEDNLLAGGDYPIYGGTAFGHTTANILIENNRFGQAYHATSGQFGPVAYFSSAGTGNVWTGNTWINSGKLIPAPTTGRP
jgi:hypothetical protein